MSKNFHSRGFVIVLAISYWFNAILKTNLTFSVNELEIVFAFSVLNGGKYINYNISNHRKLKIFQNDRIGYYVH